MSVWREPWHPIRRATGITACVGIGLLALWMATADQGWLMILDGTNLVFHEAGHLVFGLLGGTMGLYGGTLGQLVFPAVVAGAGGFRRHPVTLAVGAAWLGQNLNNIARYADDARAQELPLVGGGEHDWTTILSRWNALSSDHKVATLFRSAGYAVVLGAAAWLAWRTWRDNSENP